MKLVLVSLLCLVCWVQAAPNTYSNYQPTYASPYIYNHYDNNGYRGREGKATEVAEAEKERKEVEGKISEGPEEKVVEELTDEEIDFLRELGEEVPDEADSDDEKENEAEVADDVSEDDEDDDSEAAVGPPPKGPKVRTPEDQMAAAKEKEIAAAEGIRVGRDQRQGRCEERQGRTCCYTYDAREGRTVWLDCNYQKFGPIDEVTDELKVEDNDRFQDNGNMDMSESVAAREGRDDSWFNNYSDYYYS